MVLRSAPTAIALLAAVLGCSACVGGRPSPDRPALVAAPGGAVTYADDSRNGQKHVVYDAEGRRDYRKGFHSDDERQREFCRLNPADGDCINRRF